MGLVSQGGVTLGLASLVASEFPAWGATLYTLILALTAIHIIVGPVLFRASLARADEIGRMDDEVSDHTVWQRDEPARA
jgi:hypothetical protein